MQKTISSGLSSERIILSPFTKEFRGEGHSYESLNFSGATLVAVFSNHTSTDLLYDAALNASVELVSGFSRLDTVGYLAVIIQDLME